MLIPHFNSFFDPYLPSPVPHDQGNSQSRIKANPFSPDWENPLQRLSNEGMVGLHITVGAEQGTGVWERDKQILMTFNIQ